MSSRAIAQKTPGRRAALRRISARRPPRVTAAPTAQDAPSPDRVLQIAWGYAPPLIVEAALNFRLFDLLEQTPQTAAQLTTQTGASFRGLSLILDALVGLELLARQGARYALTPESAAFLVSTRPTYYGAYFTHTIRQVIPRWLHLAEAVRSGRPVVAVNQQNQGPLFFAEFVESLFPLNYKAARMLGEHLGVPDATAPLGVLDVAAGSGVWGIALAHLSPHVRIWAVDWPEVLKVTCQVARRQGVADRLEVSAGDLLEVDFGKDHQVAIFGHILHSEGAERSRKLLRKAFAALRPGGTVAIAEFMPNADRTGPANALLFAVNMLVHTESGSTFTFQEISEWLAQAGFTKPRLLEAPSPSPLILATRAE